ncbi:MAG: sugar phosphate isomerase/epimerase [Verrucomicrobia bacterium]|nr:sugar phosphate isomerase/epimerase [Verrucomicrobiota bacterium]
MTPCLFSVSYAGFWGQSALSLPDFVARASTLGFPAVMLAGKRPHLSPLDATPTAVDALRTTLDQHHVRCEVIAGYTHLVPAGAPEVPFLEMQIAYVESLARLGKALGAGIVRVFTSYETEGTDPQAIWQRTVTGLREMADRVAPLGTTLAIQNHHDLGLATPALLDLLGEIARPNCKLGFDAWSPALRGEDLYTVARQAAPHTVITTNADYVRVPRWRYRPEFVNYERQSPDWVRAVEFGSGFIDYPAFFRGLRDGGFDGLAVYEMCSPVAGGGGSANLDAKARGYLSWMKTQGFA